MSLQLLGISLIIQSGLMEYDVTCKVLPSHLRFKTMVLFSCSHVPNEHSLDYAMEGMRADGDLMRLTESFITDRSVKLVIHDNQCIEARVGT